jgi:hypothetical protein
MYRNVRAVRLDWAICLGAATELMLAVMNKRNILNSPNMEGTVEYVQEKEDRNRL